MVVRTSSRCCGLRAENRRPICPPKEFSPWRVYRGSKVRGKILLDLKTFILSNQLQQILIDRMANLTGQLLSWEGPTRYNLHKQEAHRQKIQERYKLKGSRSPVSRNPRRKDLSEKISEKKPQKPHILKIKGKIRTWTSPEGNSRHLSARLVFPVGRAWFSRTLASCSD